MYSVKTDMDRNYLSEEGIQNICLGLKDGCILKHIGYCLLRYGVQSYE